MAMRGRKVVKEGRNTADSQWKLHDIGAGIEAGFAPGYTFHLQMPAWSSKCRDTSLDGWDVFEFWTPLSGRPDSEAIGFAC